MSYERKIWVNNQTKLNATNMNHIEEGIESASVDASSSLELAQAATAKIDSLSVSVTDAAQKATSASNLATEAKSLADDAVSQIKNVTTTAEEAKASADLAVNKVSEKQDILVSGTNIKSLNGESILGTGDIKVATNMPFSALIKADLNTLSEQGIYKIETAANYPVGTSASGTLHVNKLGDTHYEQL